MHVRARLYAWMTQACIKQLYTLVRHFGALGYARALSKVVEVTDKMASVAPMKLSISTRLYFEHNVLVQDRHDPATPSHALPQRLPC